MRRILRTMWGALLLTAAWAGVANAQDSIQARPPLIPCTSASDGPCVKLATSAADIAGAWKQYLGNPRLAAPGGMGFIRYRQDGTFSLADTVENTATPYGMYPHGRVTFDGNVMTILVESDAPPECKAPATYHVYVIRDGAAPVALTYVPIEDACTPRTADVALPLMWAAP